MNSILIYGLYDPRTGELHYVGKTKHGAARISHHLYRARKGQRTPLGAWLRSLIAAGLVPEMQIIEETTEAHWQERERFWIRHFRDTGARLTNFTEGGEGGATMKGKQFSDSHRKAISAALKGHSVSSDVRERLRQAHKGKPPSNKIALDEVALREMYLEQRATAYQIAVALNVSKSAIYSRLRKLGITRTNSEAQKGRRDSIQTRLKKGKLSPETIKAISDELVKACNQRALARRYGVCPQTIANIKKGRWSVITGI